MGDDRCHLAEGKRSQKWMGAEGSGGAGRLGRWRGRVWPVWAEDTCVAAEVGPGWPSGRSPTMKTGQGSRWQAAGEQK